ncbi:hypothetical protein [Lacimicrobium alkaliphilum]|uniref:Uncharacterized protein n=1 Tax=Lacimicrobium alkaliphilum TaxID=1526571 RepID=A0ABQ1RJT5_9ALTE|nr:hypothetical protein [Lacimicrobium alkaliphilum]GGD72939.1 hypothetical protein GCM10011357_29990 [Lacimicrobium alkaliphilum]
MKTFFLVLLIAAAMVMSIGAILDAVTGLSFYFGETLLNPIQASIGAIVAGAVFILLGSLLAISLIGVICVVLASVFIALLVAGVSAMWPALLLVLVIYLLVRDKKTARYC